MDNATANAIYINLKRKFAVNFHAIILNVQGGLQFLRIEGFLYKSKELANVRTFIITAISFIFRTR